MESKAARHALWMTLVTAAALISVAALVADHRSPSLPTVAYAVQTDYRQYDIAVSSGSGTRMLTDDKLSYAPAWSPDGAHVAYLRGEPDSWEECCGYEQVRLWLMDPDGSDAHPVSEVLPFAGSVPQWEPSGETVLMPVYTDGHAKQLVRIDMRTGKTTTALQTLKAFREISLSADGTALASNQDRVLQAVITTLADGVGEPFNPEDFVSAYQPQWSPDGSWIVMQGWVRGRDDGVWAQNLKTGELVQVSQSGGTQYAWVSGSQLLICRSSDDVGELWMVYLDNNGSTERVSDGVDFIGPAQASGDCLGDDMDVRAVNP
jgi:Tol biopolymer transport system component